MVRVRIYKDNTDDLLLDVVVEQDVADALVRFAEDEGYGVETS